MFAHPLRLLAILACIPSLIPAAPSPAPSSAREISLDDILKYGIPEDTGAKTLHGRSILRKRGHNQNFFHGIVPGCSDHDDPSYAVGKSNYTDGEGTQISTGHCDNGKIGGWHCWTDMFYVHVQVEFDEWTNTGVGIDCKTTSQCALQSVILNQSCTANTESWDNSIQVNIEGKLDEVKKLLWPIGGGFQYQHNWGGSHTYTTCNTVADQGNCMWQDQCCHTVWKSKRNKRVFGYMRRSCDSKRDGTNLSQTRAGDGYYTIGMLDFDIVVPDSQVIGCAAQCNDTKYPDPKPATREKVAWPGS